MADEHDEVPSEESAAPEESRDLSPFLERMLLGQTPRLNRVEVAKRAGVPLELAEALWHSLGFPHTPNEEVAFTKADVRALKQTADLIAAGVLDEDSQAALVRTWGRSYSRLAEWQVGLLAGLAWEDEDPEGRLTQLAAEVIPKVEKLQSYIWRRHLLSAAGRLLARADQDGATRQAVGFVDIVGYTSQSKNLDRADLVELVEHFEDTSAGVVTDHNGQLIKTIGDEILFVTSDAADAARIALELVHRNEEDETFPAVRAGVAFGDVVNRLGDVYGPTVNIASRLTSTARPRRVLVDEGMHDELDELNEFRLRRTRRTSVKGYSRLDSWRLSHPRSRVDEPFLGERSSNSGPDLDDLKDRAEERAAEVARRRREAHERSEMIAIEAAGVLSGQVPLSKALRLSRLVKVLETPESAPDDEDDEGEPEGHGESDREE